MTQEKRTDAPEVEHTGSRPLVSVVVLTFNSAATILDTLQSLLAQQYSPLEILVADDASADATPTLVQAWLRENQARFSRAEWLPSGRNEGICGNVAKGYGHARGQWLKPIAGDDLLEPHAIARLVDAAHRSNADVVVARLRTFDDGLESEFAGGTVLPLPADEATIDGPASVMHDLLSRRNPIPAPAVMVRREAYESVGGVDRRFRHLDDWPLWLRLMEAGRTFHVAKETLVLYRVSAASISSRRMAINVNKDFLTDLITFYDTYQRHRLPPLQRWHRSLEIRRWGLAKGALRQHPTLYKMTRILMLASPLLWTELWASRERP